VSGRTVKQIVYRELKVRCPACDAPDVVAVGIGGGFYRMECECGLTATISTVFERREKEKGE